eukprot:263114-Chlamydomonas_euryale.AAC.4
MRYRRIEPPVRYKRDAQPSGAGMVHRHQVVLVWRGPLDECHPSFKVQGWCAEVVMVGWQRGGTCYHMSSTVVAGCHVWGAP